MAPRLDVCQVINSLGYGGAEHLLVDLTAAIRDVEMTVLALGDDDSLAEDLRAAGATVELLDESFRYDPRTVRRVARRLSRGTFDLVHAHLPYAQTVGRLAATIAGNGAVVSTQHNVPSNYHPVPRFTERATRRLDDATVAVSTGVERAHTGNAHQPNDVDGRWCTIYNGIDVRRFAGRVDAADGESIRRTYDVDPDEMLVLSVGRYVPDKAHEKLIEGFAASSLGDGALLLVGHGPREEALERLATRFGVASSVHVTGRVESIAPYYAAADVFASSSRVEGMPVTLLEAMSARLPVVASDIPGVDEVVVDGTTGLLYPYEKPAALGAKLDALRDASVRDRLGTAGYDRVNAEFDVDAMARSYRSLYERVTSASGR